MLSILEHRGEWMCHFFAPVCEVLAWYGRGIMEVTALLRQPQGSCNGGQWRSVPPPAETITDTLSYQQRKSYLGFAVLRLLGRQRTLRKRGGVWSCRSVFAFADLGLYTREFQPTLATPVELGGQVAADMLNAGEIAANVECIQAAAKAAPYGFLEHRSDLITRKIRVRQPLRVWPTTLIIETAAAVRGRAYAVALDSSGALPDVPHYALDKTMSDVKFLFACNAPEGPICLGHDSRLLHRLMHDGRGQTPLARHFAPPLAAPGGNGAAFGVSLCLLGRTHANDPIFQQAALLLRFALSNQCPSRDTDRETNQRIFIDHLRENSGSKASTAWRAYKVLNKLPSPLADSATSREFINQCDTALSTLG